MASPQLEHGYTKIAHEILEAAAAAGLSGLELSTVLIVWRHSYGFHRKECELAAPYVAVKCGCSERTAKRVINSLINRKVLTVVRDATNREGRLVKFNKDYEAWEGFEVTSMTPQEDLGVTSVTPLGVTSVTPLGVTSMTPIKDSTKDNKDSTGAKAPTGAVLEHYCRSTMTTTVQVSPSDLGDIKSDCSVHGQAVVIRAIDLAVQSKLDRKQYKRGKPQLGPDIRTYRYCQAFINEAKQQIDQERQEQYQTSAVPDVDATREYLRSLGVE